MKNNLSKIPLRDLVELYRNSKLPFVSLSLNKTSFDDAWLRFKKTKTYRVTLAKNILVAHLKWLEKNYTLIKNNSK